MKTLENIDGQSNRRWLSFASFGSTLIALLLPKCPLCAMAILSVLGLSADFDPGIFYPLTLIFILFGLGAVALRARQKGNYKPLYLAVAASALILTGKFYFVSTAAFYTGAGLFMVAVLWNGYLPAARKCHTNCKC